MQVAMEMAAKRGDRREAGGRKAASAALAPAVEAGREPAETVSAGSGPLRRCLATRVVRPKAELLRFVVGPDGTLVPDLAGKLPGRGLWVSADRAALELAAKKNLFAKAAETSVRVPEGLTEEVARLLRRRCLALIGLARGAGQAAAGFEKVREWLARGRVGVLLEANDAAPDGRRRLRAKAQSEAARAGEREAPAVIDLFTAAELAAALGREHVVHAALAEGGLARALKTDAARLAGLLPARDN
jgi:hypothetical protein